MAKLSTEVAIPQSTQTDPFPEGLKGYEPAKKWNAKTIEWWARLSEMSREPAGWPRPSMEIPVEEWSQIRDDMIRTTGRTPWTKADPAGNLELLFAGIWIRPALKVWTIEELRSMGVEIPFALGRE